ncbi:MAG TPA: hypothetical protein VFW98_07380 [Gemmatimonadaceae bacterium]|nr:hypothetical protein [Gemmatimonadaceae bacterium]
MPADAFRPRSSSEILDASVQLLRVHYAPLLVLSAIAWVPRLVVSVTGKAYVRPALGVGASVTTLVLVLVAMAWFVIAQAAMLVAVSDIYVGGGANPARALRAALTRPGAIILSVLAKVILIAVGLLIAGIGMGVVAALVAGVGSAMPRGIALVLVGVGIGAAIFAGVWWSLRMFAFYFAVPATVVLEQLGAGAALTRANQLARGSALRIVLTLVLLYIIYLAVLALLGAVVYLAFHGFVLTQTLVTVFALFVYPIIPVVTALLYYDLRIRKEGYDIELMAGALNDPPATQPA